MGEPLRAGAGPARRYRRGDGEFERVSNLSDAIFAIAMTLLVLTLERPDVSAAQLGSALVDQAPQLIAFVLSFALVANAWWLHHKFFALLEEIEPGLIAINLALLMAVALVPFPTSLIGHEPTAQAAVIPYISVMLVLSGLFVGLLLRSVALDLWREPLPDGLLPWLLAGWALAIGVIAVALGVAIWVPVAGLALLPFGSVVELVIRRRAPAEYGSWA